MHARYSPSLLLLASLVLGACSDRELPTETPASDPTFAIADAASGFRAGFYWLPPLVKQTSFSGDFDATLSPEVEICRLDADAECVEQVVRFTMDGSGPEAVRLDVDSEQYSVTWRLYHFDLSAASHYRISVLAGNELLLGHADVELVSTPREARDVDTNKYIAVIRSQALQINFRIEVGALGGGFTLVPNLPTDELVLHVNPADPNLLTIPTGEGDLFQYFGWKDPQGRAVSVRGVRRFSPADPESSDLMILNDDLLPTLIRLRDGGRIMFTYLPDNQVRMTVADEEGTLESVYFTFVPDIATAASFADLSTAAAQTQDVLSGVIDVFARVTQDGVGPVDDAFVEGSWLATGTEQQSNSFVAEPIGDGVYRTAIATAPIDPGTLEDRFFDICEPTDLLVTAACLSIGDSTRGWVLVASRACSRFVNPKLVAICVAGISTVGPAWCKGRPPCSQMNLAYDLYVLEPSLTVEVGAERFGVRAWDSRFFFEPFPETVTIDLQLEEPIESLDTGPGSSAGAGLFSVGTLSDFPDAFQFLAGRFTIWTPATATGIEGWMRVWESGSILVTIRANDDGVPGAILASRTYTLASDGGFPPPHRWRAFSGFNASLSPGTYWVTLEPIANAGFDGGMAGAAPRPFADYAVFNEANPRWRAYSGFGQNPGFGFRIHVDR